MDRITMTNGGALGSGRETAAGPAAGAPPGRFGKRRVSVGPEAPRPLPGLGHEVGSGIASVARPEVARFGTATEAASSSGLPGATAVQELRPGRTGPAQPPPPAPRPPSDARAGQGASEFAPGSTADAPGTSSGAFAASDVRGRPRNLPEPSPTKSYRRRWNRFVIWCEERNLQYWPAKPETVADYLKDCAKKCSARTLDLVRSAIASTHRRAGLASPDATDVVKATYDELVEAKGGFVRRSRNITGRSLNAAQLDSIRAAAFYPKRKGRSEESDETTWHRGQVTLALCSLVLEAGLQCDQAAALEWRDVWRGENEAPAITIRKGSADADHVVEISLRAIEDLINIAPKHAEPHAKIFAINAQRIAVQIREAAQCAGLESLIEGPGLRHVAPGAATGTGKTRKTRRTALAAGRETAAGPMAGIPAGDVRERQVSLPEPSPTAGYRWYWDEFVSWCEGHNEPYWPARPETVADYLRCRAGRCSSRTLHTIRNAISKTHREAGWGELFAGGVVAATLEELASAKGEVRSRSTNVSGISLNAAELDKIRDAALQPRRHGPRYETRETATRRGRVDLALCSLVLEAGFLCDQAAALEWRDLTVDANDKPTITVRPGSAGADDVIEISKRAHEDLCTIAPKNAGAGKWIFGLNAERIGERIRAVARVAGLESQIVGKAPRQGAHDETAGLSAKTVCLRAGYWQAFCTWCDRRGMEKLPASAETVAKYLREGSEATSMEKIYNKRYAIREAHLKAKHDDPCATPLVEATIRDIRQTIAGFLPKSLNPAALTAIRATAALPRPTGRGQESGEVARKRGLVDMALCSVVHAAGLSVEQAVSLKWRDVEKPGEDEAKLTVKSGTGLHGSAKIREIAGQAVRDLEAIRGDARSEDSVFGLTMHQAYRHINEVARHAGLLVPGEPSTAGLSHMATAHPSHNSPAHPWLTAPAHPWLMDPADSWLMDPADSWLMDPADSWLMDPADSWLMDPADSWLMDPADSWITPPADLRFTAPAHPWQTFMEGPPPTSQ